MESVSSSDVDAKGVIGSFLQPGVWCDLEVGKLVEGVSKDLQRPVIPTDGAQYLPPSGRRTREFPVSSITHSRLF